MSSENSFVKAKENENTLFPCPPPPIPVRKEHEPKDPPSEYCYISEAMESYPDFYDNVLDDLSKLGITPSYDAESSNFFTTLSPLLNFEDIDTIVLPPPAQAQEPIDSGNNSSKVLNSPPPTLIADEFDNQVNPPIIPSVTMEDAESADATPSVEAIFEVLTRPSKTRRLNAESDIAPLAIPQEKEQSNANPYIGFTPKDATAAEMQLLLKFMRLKSRPNMNAEATNIMVASGEDIAEKITSFARNKRPIFVFGTVGCLSIVQLHQEKTATFEGKYNIISLVGAFLHPKQGDQHETDQLCVTVVGTDGVVFGGLVHGRLVAASIVQMVCVSFTPIGRRLKHLKIKQKHLQHQADITSMNHDCEA